MMNNILTVISILSMFLIFWAMLGYPLSLIMIDKIGKPKENKLGQDDNLSVTVMVVAHNEEKVILEKLENIVQLEYPKDKISFLISSDNSTDRTNEIVREFIHEHQHFNIRLHEVEERKGKTNAQDSAQKLVKSDILVMTDANSIIEKSAIKQLVSSFCDEDVVYVCGKLVYSNVDVADSASSEDTYWNLDLRLRDIESRLQTITAGNGALYAVRNDAYKHVKLIHSHDSAMPLYYALEGKRALFNKNAVAYEKAGENIGDEYKRKVRMNRIILDWILPDFRILNIFKYKWFTYFYLGHRTARYLLFINHFLLFLTSFILAFQSPVFLLLLVGQVLFYGLALLELLFKTNNKFLKLAYYYCVTIVAQLHGAYNVVTGKAKPFWEKAESTR